MLISTLLDVSFLCLVYSRRNNLRCAPGARAATININTQSDGELDLSVFGLAGGSDKRLMTTL